MANRLLLCLFCLLFGTFLAKAQEVSKLSVQKKFLADQNSIKLDSLSISPFGFKILDADKNEIDSSAYKIDYSTATITLNKEFSKDSLTAVYTKLPEFLTKTYKNYDDSRVVSDTARSQNLYRITAETPKKFTPFEGLNTSGSITRGVTVGNNQNAVVNSNLDLQITGKISEDVSLRASIQDSNIPLQDNGYSQKLDEFDQIFIELFSDKWAIRAGDLFLENRKSRFLNFNKKVQGISTSYEFGKTGNQTIAHASAALVRGQYAKSTFVGQEGNQGPYKLRGSNGELFILVISGSERVYVNGILLKRGESNDYTIDYNAGEITFTSLFPINSEMRINVEYQFSDRNYTRFVTYFGAEHNRKTWSLSANVYSEKDVKNQSLQQNLSPEQAQILAQAGDNIDLMTAPSAYVDSYSENKILYIKTTSNGVEIFQYSNDAMAVLYNVRFTLVGNNLGDYNLANSDAVGKIFEYIAAINGVKQGNYAAITRLIAPTKIQIADILGKIAPSEKTNIDFELGVSNNDQNLFSNLDDNNNNGVAAKINARQRIFTGKGKIDAFANLQFVQNDFRSIERLYNIEFNRDWNLTETTGNQSLLVTGITSKFDKQEDSKLFGEATYQFEKLDFSKSFSGSRHVVFGDMKYGKIRIQENGSSLNTDATLLKSSFLRNTTLAKVDFKKNWVGATIRGEDNSEILKSTNTLTPKSQRFFEYGAFAGRGDSTKVFLEIGYLHRANDSLQNLKLSRVNVSDSYYLKSKLIQNEKTDLSAYINYRELKYENPLIDRESSINSRILYNDRYFDQLILSTTAFETSSGTIPQQEFTYLEVEPGQGVYTWNDYNGDGIQQLQEFEVAPFQDLGKYVRVFLPNQIFVKTHQNKLSQSLTFNFNQWQNAKGFKRFASFFYNQSAYVIDRKTKREGDAIDLNPFGPDSDKVLGLASSFRNSLYYNRGKQNHSVTYSFLESKAKNLLSTGAQQSGNKSHQLQYQHLYRKSWLLAFFTKSIFISAEVESYAARNYKIEGYQLAPKIAYLFSKNASWDVFYEYQIKENQLIGSEKLDQSRFGTSFTYSGESKFTMNGEFSLYENDFVGDRNTPAAFTILEGLLPGKNLAWRLLIQKNLTEYLDINVNYEGRKSETSKAIHTGNIQLRAYF